MLKLIVAMVTAAGLSLSTATAGHDGLVRKESANNFDETVAKLKEAIETRGITLMATVDHSANAEKAGLSLPPTTLLIFGNPAAGTTLMQQSRTVAIDLPMKALVYVNDNGKVCVEYNDVSYLAERHGIDKGFPVVGKINGVLDAITSEATGAE
ncbi:MAG: DUF302 domain-containing protein [Pseudomonadota bacterium]